MNLQKQERLLSIAAPATIAVVCAAALWISIALWHRGDAAIVVVALVVGAYYLGTRNPRR